MSLFFIYFDFVVMLNIIMIEIYVNDISFYIVLGTYMYDNVYCL